MERLIEGRMVHYVLHYGRSQGQHRAAIVVRVCEEGVVNLSVLVDGANDDFREEHHFAEHHITFFPLTLWRTSVHYSETKEPNTWHWIEQA
jgi:hypothetical protein